jgi:hypothetical protein
MPTLTGVTVFHYSKLTYSLFCQVQNDITQLLHVITTRAVTLSFSYETHVNQESNTPQNGTLTRELIQLQETKCLAASLRFDKNGCVIPRLQTLLIKLKS